MSDLANDLESLSDLLAEARLLRLVLRGTDNEPGLIHEVIETRATAEEISTAVAKARELERINFDSLADLRQALNSISENILETVTRAGSEYAVIDAMRVACQKMASSAISESAKTALLDAAKSVQVELADDMKNIAIGKFGNYSPKEIVEAWAELVETKKRAEILESENLKLRERNKLFEDSASGVQELQFVNARQWAIAGAVSGTVGGILLGGALVILAIATKIISL